MTEYTIDDLHDEIQVMKKNMNMFDYTDTQLALYMYAKKIVELTNKTQELEEVINEQ